MKLIPKLDAALKRFVRWSDQLDAEKILELFLSLLFLAGLALLGIVIFSL